jgi:hypothetical protein
MRCVDSCAFPSHHNSQCRRHRFNDFVPYNPFHCNDWDVQRDVRRGSAISLRVLGAYRDRWPALTRRHGLAGWSQALLDYDVVVVVGAVVVGAVVIVTLVSIRLLTVV